ncbi:MAG TPA: replicative DNA helicase [Candidatus Absconditabacterales bacterium]|nr:replicative DNA helicase [Candidatus Absconditabacterales bacterium]HRU50359.1 replicative DNA helicase [Candidatus Absconditabacterales bacterium]
MVTINDIKLPPHNIEAEKGVLSGVLMDKDTLYIYNGDRLGPEDFYKKEHQKIYEAILQLDNKTIDVVTLGNQLEKNGDLDFVGGLDYLYELSTFLLSTSGCSEYSKIVKDKSLLRQILKTSQNIIGDVYKQENTTNILESIEKNIFDLTQSQTGNNIQHINEIMGGRTKEYMAIVDDPEKVNSTKVFSGYKKLDEMLGGFKPGELIIIAARPSMGKTSFALNIVTNIALQQDKSIAIFSLEMGAESIVDRIIAEVAQIPMSKITKGDLNNDDFSKIGEAMTILGDKKIYIDDKSAANIPLLKSKLRRLKVEKGELDLVIIDYLQLMHGTSFLGNRVQEISEISRGLKELARELEVPIIALSQLSRAVEQRIDKKPQLSDLRESGAIEQDADSVIMLHREDYYDKDTDKKGSTDVCVRKNRNGEVGEIELYFKASIMKFIDLKDNTDGTEN